MYEEYPGCECVGRAKIWLMGGETEVKFFHKPIIVKGPNGEPTFKQVDYVFVDHPKCFRREGLYGKDGKDYEDNLYRFSLFSIAALEAPKLRLGKLGAYGDKVVFMVNDWQTALLPLYLCHRHRPRKEFLDARCIFVVHNFGYQGIWALDMLTRKGGELHEPICLLGLDPNLVWGDLVFTYDDGGVVMNLSKAALCTADRILTVSPGYANEMKTREFGFPLQDVVQRRNHWTVGILNGIDTKVWNPRTDKFLTANYGPEDFVKGRAACKKQLQEQLKLKVDPNVALISFVGRLAFQKGVDIILGAIDWLMKDEGNGI